MPATEIRVFRNADGTSPFMDWLDDLEIKEPKIHAKCLHSILALSHDGLQKLRAERWLATKTLQRS